MSYNLSEANMSMSMSFMSKLANAGVGKPIRNVVTANYYAYFIVHSTTCNKRQLWNPSSGPHLCTMIWVHAMIGQ